MASSVVVVDVIRMLLQEEDERARLMQAIHAGASHLKSVEEDASGTSLEPLQLELPRDLRNFIQGALCHDPRCFSKVQKTGASSTYLIDADLRLASQTQIQSQSESRPRTTLQPSMESCILSSRDCDVMKDTIADLKNADATDAIDATSPSFLDQYLATINVSPSHLACHTEDVHNTKSQPEQPEGGDENQEEHKLADPGPPQLNMQSYNPTDLHALPDTDERDDAARRAAAAFG